MYKKSIQIVRGSIFPIFWLGHNGDIACLGTGFFIDFEGNFITASHVVSSPPPNGQLVYAGNVPNFNGSGQFIPISISSVDPQKDLASGIINSGALPPLILAMNEASLGESISLSGYSMPYIQSIGHRSFELGAVRQYWQPTIKLDEIAPNFLFNNKFKSFMTQHVSLPGMSGGPIFNLNGEVVGVASANLTRKIARPNGHELTVENGIGIELSELKSFIINHVPNSLLNVVTQEPALS